MIEDMILFWNDVVLEVSKSDFTPLDGSLNPENPGPTFTSRAYAMVHLALADALLAANGENTYLTYTEIPPNSALAQKAGISEVARRVLGALYPRQRLYIDEKHREVIVEFDIGLADREAGEAWGWHIALAMIGHRKNDGAFSVNSLTLSEQPGYHRPDPMNPDQKLLGSHWGYVTPFLVKPSDIPNTDPPHLSSLDYATSFNQVKTLGSRNSAVRTPEQTLIGIFWAYDGAKGIGVPIRLYNQVVRAILKKYNDHHTKTDELTNVLILAKVNVAMADAAIQCWREKYYHQLWRPIVGIREADAGYGKSKLGDGNTQTDVDPLWIPLGSPRTNQAGGKPFTPAFPAYPSGHATMGTAAIRSVQYELNLKDDFEFEFTSDEFNGESFDEHGVRPVHQRALTIQKAIDENNISRVYLGVHWDFDAIDGSANGEAVAKIVRDKLFNENSGDSESNNG